MVHMVAGLILSLVPDIPGSWTWCIGKLGPFRVLGVHNYIWQRSKKYGLYGKGTKGFV